MLFISTGDWLVDPSIATHMLSTSALPGMCLGQRAQAKGTYKGLKRVLCTYM